MTYLRYLCLFTYNGVFFVLFMFVFCLVHPMLPVSLDCPFFLIAPSVFSNGYLKHMYNLHNILFGIQASCYTTVFSF